MPAAPTSATAFVQSNARGLGPASTAIAHAADEVALGRAFVESGPHETEPAEKLATVPEACSVEKAANTSSPRPTPTTEEP